MGLIRKVGRGSACRIPRVVGEGREASCLCACHAWVGVETGEWG